MQCSTPPYARVSLAQAVPCSLSTWWPHHLSRSALLHDAHSSRRGWGVRHGGARPVGRSGGCRFCLATESSEGPTSIHCRPVLGSSGFQSRGA
eukprot:3602149-Alexandrium_andersonii.AAC.2